MRLTIGLIFLAALLALASCPGMAGNYAVNWSTVSSGGGDASSGSFRFSGTVGQSAASFVAGNSRLHWVGFWSSDLPVPTIALTAASAKTMSDGSFVGIAGRIATSATGDFSEYFYVQDPSWMSGIRVDVPPSMVNGLIRGSVVDVVGAIGTTPSGERQMVTPMVIIASATAPVGALEMNTPTIGGGNLGVPPLGQCGVTGGRGLNNIGMLIRVIGSVGLVGDNYIEVNDGGAPLRVDTSALTSVPQQGDFVYVTGIASLYDEMPGVVRRPLLLPRNDDDIGYLSR